MKIKRCQINDKMPTPYYLYNHYINPPPPQKAAAYQEHLGSKPAFHGVRCRQRWINNGPAKMKSRGCGAESPAGAAAHKQSGHAIRPNTGAGRSRGHRGIGALDSRQSSGPLAARPREAPSVGASLIPAVACPCCSAQGHAAPALLESPQIRGLLCVTVDALAGSHELVIWLVASRGCRGVRALGCCTEAASEGESLVGCGLGGALRGWDVERFY